jgi:antitoxin FitA
MPTLTIRSVPEHVVRSLKTRAARHGRSMEQEVREMLEDQLAERASVLDQIRAMWPKQRRRPSAAEVDQWLETGR